jgi:hypothetical protein
MGDGIELAHAVAAESFQPKPAVAYFKNAWHCMPD